MRYACLVYFDPQNVFNQSPEAEAVLAGTPPDAHPGWELVFARPGVQMVDESVRAEPDPDAVRLTPADATEVLDLVTRTDAAPFRPRTLEMGTYLGIRRDGRLIAMAGERFRPPAWTEISAVCTDPAYRGQGLATRLVRAVSDGIRDSGATPFLHTSADNVRAIRLYESLGFRLRRTTAFALFRSSASHPGLPKS